MSKYKYFSVHDLKDLASIYNDCDDFRVVVWNPTEQKEMRLSFTGSNNVEKTVSFNVEYTDENYHRYKWNWMMFKLKIKVKLARLRGKFMRSEK